MYRVGKEKCPNRSHLLPSDFLLTPLIGQTQPEVCPGGQGTQALQGSAFQYTQQGKEGQRMIWKEDKWRIGCIGGINPERCYNFSNWGANWDSPWCVGDAGRTLRLFTLPPPGLYTVWKVLHVQLGPRWASAAEDHEGWDGQWAGDHARHPAGRVPARMGGDWYVTSLRDPSPCLWGSTSARRLLGSTVGPEAGLGLSFLPSILPSPSPTLPDCHTYISLAPPSWLSYSPR